MKALLQAYADFLHAVTAAVRTPRVLALLSVSALIASGGALVYSLLEGWRYVDALYFCVVSMATVGYGDLAPVTFAGRMFTIGFLLLGIGIFVLTVGTFAEVILKELRQRRDLPR